MPATSLGARSGAPFSKYIPALRLAITFAVTAASTVEGPLGMNCSMPYGNFTPSFPRGNRHTQKTSHRSFPTPQ
jgi:hypothetical protein